MSDTQHELSPSYSFSKNPKVSIAMGSKSDWPTMQHTAKILHDFNVPFEAQIVSAHRTPDWMSEYAKGAQQRGIEVIIAGAGGAAHLPGMIAAQTLLPVLGVPIESKALQGMDSLLSIAQMPGGIPVGTLAIGKPGAINAALLSIAILANHDSVLQKALEQYRKTQTKVVMDTSLGNET
ncbi:MAG: 5-(carboxyamino)imidazole ribonucleotide mutase [Bdellovibrionota bacterium]